MHGLFRNSNGSIINSAWAFLPLASVLVVYWGVWENSFVWDDLTLFIQNAELRAGDLTWAAISRPILEGTTYFRPFVLLSFAGEFRFFGVDAAICHISNLGLHALNGALIYWIAAALFRRSNFSHVEMRAAVAGVIYAVHPSMVEPTAWISGRFDLMATTFTLLAVVIDLRIRIKIAHATLLSLTFAAALGSKELGVLLPIFLLITRQIWWRMPGERMVDAAVRIVREEHITIFAMMAVFSAYLVLRVNSVGALTHTDNELARQLASPMLHVLLILNTLWFYIVECVVPFSRVAPFHPLDMSVVTSGRGIAAAFGAVALLGGLLWGARRALFPALLLFMAVLALAPVLHIVPLTIAGNIGHDRFLALPLAFGSIAFASCRFKTKQNDQARFVLAVIYVALFAWIVMAVAISRVTVPLWKSDEVLWAWAYERSPHFSAAKSAYVGSLLQNNKYEKIDAMFNDAAEQGEVSLQLYISYGKSLIDRDRLEEGEAILIDAQNILLDEKYGAGEREKKNNANSAAQIGSLLAIVSIKRRLYEVALTRLDASLIRGKEPPIVLLRKSLVLLALGRMTEGLQLYARARSLTLPAHTAEFDEISAKFVAEYCLEKQNHLAQLCTESALLRRSGAH